MIICSLKGRFIWKMSNQVHIVERVVLVVLGSIPPSGVLLISSGLLAKLIKAYEKAGMSFVILCAIVIASWAGPVWVAVRHQQASRACYLAFGFAGPGLAFVGYKALVDIL